MKRVIAPLLLLTLVVLAGCSSTPSAGSSSVSPAKTSIASSPSEAASQSASEMTSPSEAPTSAPVTGGTATDFCGAVKEIQALMRASSEAPSGDLVSWGAQLRAGAADMRKFAPAEIATAANTYANVMDNIGKVAASGTTDKAAMLKAISDGMAGNGKDIGTTATWMAKNCNL